MSANQVPTTSGEAAPVRVFAQSPWAHVAITVSFVLCTVFLIYELPLVTLRMIDGYMTGPLPVASKSFPAEPVIGKSLVLSEGERARLLEQLTEIRSLERHHFQVMKFVYSLYHVAIELTLMSSILSAVCLFKVTRQGWQNSSPFLRNAFLSFAALTAFAGALPAAFSHQENISENKSRYLAYSALERDNLTYLAIGQHANLELKTPEDVIFYNDKTLKVLDDYSVFMDVSKLPHTQINLK